jgi:hypothetical protein
VDEQAVVEASLDPRRGARWLGRRWERVEGRSHLGGRRSGVHAQGGSGVAFYRQARARG